ncbi:MAG: hypothetical protein K9L84_03565 [Candidatus Omnitrophica bacterium]|nr:hypothetical protein [Candidatus Omnitrophota bacterium]MCF7894117.1 hypothetical protein [Candidatus Omnitrophota bacterium]
MNKVKIIIRLILYISIGLLVASFFFKRKLPKKDEILPQLYQSPFQEKTNLSDFKVEASGVDYVVKPLYHYVLYGLVVSLHDSRVWWDIYHKNWGDYLNVNDFCVIWGDNLKNNAYTRMKFSSGSWTCRVGVNSDTAEKDWAKFDLSYLSNNHILVDDPEIKKSLKRVAKGDQIYLKGYLVTYFADNKKNNFARSSSVTRTDKGNGACEVVYLKDFKILKKANLGWHFIFNLVKYLVVVCLLLLLIFHFRSPLD